VKDEDAIGSTHLKAAVEPPDSLQTPLPPVTPLFPASPRIGQTREVAPGIYWLRSALPFRLNAVNLWLLEDGDGWTMVDCGYPLPDVREQIEAAWSHLLGGRPIRRLIVTHHHPDHVGNCRWICDRWGITPWLSAAEYEKAQELASGGLDRIRRRAVFWRRHGLSAALGEQVVQMWGQGLQRFQPLEEYRLVSEGERIRVGQYEWQVMVGRGHAPEQVLLYSPLAKLLISGDQVLNSITPNVSVSYEAPEADPLGLFLESNRHIAETCGEVAVLPSHKHPFRGLPCRVREIEKHHQARLEKVLRELRKGPATAASMLPALFGDPGTLTVHEIGFAIGEAIAHLNHLVAVGRAVREKMADEILFVRT